MEIDTQWDPLSMNLRGKWDAIAHHFDGLPSQDTVSTEQLVDTLTHLLHDARYTLLIAQKFRPILLVLCARWLDHQGDEDAKLAALAALIHVHEELFPIFSTFIRSTYFYKGPLERISSFSSLSQLHLRLVAYYRILVACPHAPALFLWSPEPLSRLLSMSALDNGVRWLAVRCYALHTRLSERQRDELQSRTLGFSGDADVSIEAGKSQGGEMQWVDGWSLPVLEAMRIRNARQAMLIEENFYTTNPSRSSLRINLAKLTHRVADIHGILLLRAPSLSTPPSGLILTQSVVDVLRALAVRLSLRLPILLSSPPSSGKSLILGHLASHLHPASLHQLVTIHLSDTSLDARSLLGSYVSSTRKPGTFEWQDGVIIRAMQHGLWLVLEDIDRASSEILGVLIPLVESLAVNKHIGAPATLDVPGRGKVEACENFAVFATRSIPTNSDGELLAPTFMGSAKFSHVDVPAPTEDDLIAIINGKFSRFGRCAAKAIIYPWAAARALGSAPGVRGIGIHELEAWCRRIESLSPPTYDSDVVMHSEEETRLERLYPQVALREEMYLEARDVFFGVGAFSDLARIYYADVARTFADHLGLSSERAQWILENRLPELQIEKDENGHTKALKIGRTRLPVASSSVELLNTRKRPFAMHRPAILLIERISTSISLADPVLLVGETGTGKTTLVSHIASLLHRRLISLNLSHQTESTDLLGGFKPVDTRIPAGELLEQFVDLFSRTFSRRKNSKFEDAVRKAVNEAKWKRVVGLWKECIRLALDKIKERNTLLPQEHSETLRGDAAFNDDTPRKRRKFEMGPGSIQEVDWLAFKSNVDVFNVQHVQGQGRFAFGFVEGPLVQALRNGYWVLLDEINLASPETLECLSSILQGPTASVILTEQGSFEPVPRHPDFRLFACMNPATDVGKRDLSANIRSRFTEVFVPPPDADRETLLAIVHQYIGHCALSDRSALLDVTEFYTEIKKLAEKRELADGSNHRPHFSMRTLARALTFASDTVLSFGLRRALWEGCIMAFSMALDGASQALVKTLAEKHLLAGVKNMRALMTQIPVVPNGDHAESFERIGHFWLERGSLEPDPASEYILTPSVQSKLMDLARVILTRRFPVLIEGPTSSGKTSAIEYLARRTGHRFVRVNNHEHTDIQEYVGTYVSDPSSGKLVFHDGILVRALRNGDWIVLDELNLAPTDVLEALNRLLDDNRELVIPETHEVVRPHPHFMLFATQNPSGLYAGRKVLSRAFRNRFLEVYFDDVPQSELQTILSERCRIPESYARRIVTVFQELSKRRQAGRVFESKHGFATLRDLFRWAGREAFSTRQLAHNGYMLLAERTRRLDDKEIVKEVIETVMKERIDTDTLYGLQHPAADFTNLGVLSPASSDVVWTSAMKRLFVLVANALKYNEPVLLVGGTGSGKTSVCQLYADAASKHLITLNCHQGTETADLIGSQRPVRNRVSSQAEFIRQAQQALRVFPDFNDTIDEVHDVDGMLSLVTKALKLTPSPAIASSLRAHQLNLQQSRALFEWYDGPLIRAMRTGDVFLLDEISLADDSVLERLNSVMEPARNIVLAERGGLDIDHAQITAHPGFKLLATMNPGGDYGKKELSPALRNRFTEIWVPQVETKSDLRMIIESSWRHSDLLMFTDHLLAFTEWLASALGVGSLISLRDILAWVYFSNSVSDSYVSLPASIIFHHAAHMVFLDGLETSYGASWSAEALHNLRGRASALLERLVPLGDHHAQAFDTAFLSTPKAVSVGPFAISKGPLDTTASTFSLQAPTTLHNIRRLIRACQLAKPILIEGSPGVGKTSLVTALSDIAGHRICRINLSDQTDLMDLFGSDLPVEGGLAGEFAWKDAAFLRAMQDGDWVLLDEMNLAPQTVLEGLNAVLDHRGTVFIPELGRSFTKHPRFRLFAAQNPLHQGGGRKGLPKSFLDRFIKVYIQPFTPNDLLLIVQNLFPTLSVDHLRSMISFNSRLHDEIMIKRSFGKDGSPWEFNLRDVIRWAMLLVAGPGLPSTSHPSEHLDILYLQRFRTEADRMRARDIFCDVFGLPSATGFSHDAHWSSTTPSHVQFGSALIKRGDYHSLDNAVELQHHLQPLAAAGVCIQKGWPLILSGRAGVGKTQLARYLASKAGRPLYELPMSSGVDTADILGSFEQTTSSSNETGRFEWIDGPLVQAMKKGHWILFDNANLCNPSVLDRLNSLCETDGFLVLTERGHIDGEIEILKPDPQFRLILTVDPHNGDLSRAMRNRAIEIHILSSPVTPQDNFRLLDAIRVPSPMWSADSVLDNLALQFDIVRRGHSRSTWSGLRAQAAIHSGLFNHDSLTSSMFNSAILHQIPSFDDPLASAHARMLFYARMLVPSSIPMLRRMNVALENTCLIENGSVSIPKAMFDELDHHPIWILRHTVAEVFTQARGVPLSFISAQPADFLMNPKLIAEDGHDSNDLANKQHVLSSAIGLLVHVYICDHSEAVTAGSAISSIFHQSRIYYNDQSGSQNLLPGVSTIFPLYASTMSFTRAILQALSLDHCEEQLLLLARVRELVDFVEHLRTSASGPHFDFTAARVISNWFQNVLASDARLLASPIRMHVESLLNEVSLFSGHGMQEIWRNLVVPDLHKGAQDILVRLERLVVCLDPKGASYDLLRADAFNAMTLLTMNFSPPSSQQDSIISLCQELEHRITSNGVLLTEGAIPQYPPQLAIAELDFLSTTLSGETSQLRLQRGNFIIKLASQTARTSLVRLTRVQHYLWMTDAHGSQVPGQLSTLISMVREWMSAVNNISLGRSCTTLWGPDILFKPVLLHDSLEICLHDQPLETLDPHEKFLRLQGTLVANQCQEKSSDRFDQVLRVWAGLLIMLAECFKETYPPDIMHKFWDAAYHGRCNDLTKLLSSSANIYLSRTVRKHLTLSSRSLDRPQQAELERFNSLGRAWVDLGLAFLELYVPNIPLDPVATQRCTSEYWRHREAEILAQIHIHESAERTITGGNTSPLLHILHDQLNEIRAKLQDAGNTLTSREVDVGSLHVLFGEITVFLTQILYSNKFHALIRDLEARKCSHSRVVTVQATISGFIARLESGYSHFADIIQPISMALSTLVFGLHLLGHATKYIVDPQLAGPLRTLVKFPTMAAIEMAKTDISLNTTTSQPLILNLIALAYDIGLCSIRADSFDRLDATYQKLTKFWREDLSDQERVLQESQSLYRHKIVDHGMPSDADVDEQEFRTMFPTYEDNDFEEQREEKQNVQIRSGLSSVPRLTNDDKERIHRLHLWITDDRHCGHQLQALDDEYCKLRTATMRDMLALHLIRLPHDLDVESLPYQILILSKGIEELESDRLAQDGSYSFYHDSNIPEVKKALSAVRTVQRRLIQLMKDWPDQMVLHHLITRCEAILKLSLRSPVAKVLCALEQLLLQTEDWEIYSNRENSLKSEQSTLSELIINWRRFELSCWARLFESQALAFSAGTVEWWFRLYELTIRGTLAVAANASSADEYFAEMIPLVEQFISDGPLGQFTTRLQLLESFGIYCERLSRIKCGPDSDVLARASRILRSLWNFYNQSHDAVSHSFTERRATLERELLDHIKLASWKDVNVHALKQSAQRTHRQLFKCVRKFRELLREPVAPILSGKASDVLIQASHLLDWSMPVFTCHDPSSPVVFPSIPALQGMVHHMLDLPRTFVKFEHLLKLQGEPLIHSLPCESIDGFAGQIAETVTVLSSETRAAGNNMQLHKTLMMRKRKAWIDLLQELKRVGLSSRLKPDILHRQQDKVWLLDRSSVMHPRHSPFYDIASEGETYFNRMLLSMPKLRHSLSSHHPDLTTRELQRAAAFVESNFALALNTKDRFVKDYSEYEALDRVVGRLRSLAANQETIIGAYDISPWLELCCKLEHALEEISSGCIQLKTLGDPTALSRETLEALATHLDAIRQSRQSLITLHNNFCVTHKMLMVPRECNTFDTARACILSTTVALENWIDEEPRIRHLCGPVLVWLSCAVSGMNTLLPDESQNEKMPQTAIIDRLLVIVQNIPPSHRSPSSLRAPNNYVSDCEVLGSTISHVLAVGSVRQAITSFVDDLAECSVARRLGTIQSMLPFVDAYLRLVNIYLLNQAQLVKSLFKLSYVLCCIVLSLTQEGFCKPPEMQESSATQAGESDEIQDGTGLGQGTGSENVSNQIADEGQVEGVRNEESAQEPPEGDTDGNDVEMTEDFEGNMQDVDGDDNEDDLDDGGQSEADEQMGKIDSTDPDAVDEKFWGDDNIQQENAEETTSKEAFGDQNDTSQVVAKENPEKRQTDKPEDSAQTSTDKTHEGSDNFNGDEAPEEYPVDSGKQMDDFVPEADMLDLPDDMDLGTAEDGQEDPDGEYGGMDEDEPQEDLSNSPGLEPAHEEVPQAPASPSQDVHPAEHDGDSCQTLQPDEEVKDLEPTVGRPDFSAGDNQSADSTVQETHGAPADGLPPSTKEDDRSIEGVMPDTQAAEAGDGSSQCNSSALAAMPLRGKNNDKQDPGSAAPMETAVESSSIPNPLRKLGDSVKEIRRRLDQIGDGPESEYSPTIALDKVEPPQHVEYLHENVDEDHGLQALGPAREDQVAKLRDLQIQDEESTFDLDAFTGNDYPTMETQNQNRDAGNPLAMMGLDAEPNTFSKVPEVEGALTKDQVDRVPPDPSQQNDHSHTESISATNTNVAVRDDTVYDEHSVEFIVKKWQETGHLDSSAGEMWRLYDSLTQELSFALCEQLRLILEPTLATRLRGDYRTGKRLNMKKIIPYIASEYTKDKIWLRRTRPSQREYQILIALDDSRSMAESRSVHLAYETLALVSKALGRLESGEVAIARFGETVELVHNFEDGMLGDREGEKVMRKFRFEQCKTDVLGLVETSLRVFRQARERRSMSRASIDAADLWQLEIIISDGICQDHKKLRTALRRAEEQRVMIVFIVVDSLHTHHIPSSDTVHTTNSQNSILSMNQVSYKDAGAGRMELQMERYLDSFPFRYYVVLRSVEALPDVLSGTLKQFFERISEE